MKKHIFFLVIAGLLFFAHTSQASDLAHEYDIFIDENTAQRGYTVASPDDQFLLGLSPRVLTDGSEVNFKILYQKEETRSDTILAGYTLDPQYQMQTKLPENKRLISGIYEFDIAQKDDYDIERPLFVKVRVPETADDITTKTLYFWDNGLQEWRPLPSSDATEPGFRRGYIHLPYARVALFEDDFMSEGYASWYKYKECDCAASPDYPKGTKLRVTSWDGKSVDVIINDWGPERDIFPERVIDLDYEAFKQIARPSIGVVRVTVEKLADPQPPAVSEL